MWGYAGRRLILAIPTLIGVTLLVFSIMRIAPGDVAVMMLGGDSGLVGRPEELEKLRHELGLDRPLHIQYLEWVSDMVRLDFGESYFYHAPMGQLIRRKLPLSFQIAVMGLSIAVTIGVTLGIIAAIKQDTKWDYIVRGFAMAAISIPGFWVAMMVILFLVRGFHWIPEQGYTPLWEDPGRNLRQLMWPILVLGLTGPIGGPLRMMRATMLEVLREDYVRTARAKGLHERVVLTRHAMRNALIPVVTVVGLTLPILVAGLIILEQVFGLPGIGAMMVSSINQRDYPVVMVQVTIVGTTIVFANLLVDITYGWLDPRIRY